MVIDETLAEDPELVRAAASATLLAVEIGALEGELRASRERLVDAGHRERRRIERDLHDGAQQRLVALRVHLGLVGEKLGRADEQAMLDGLAPRSSRRSTSCATSRTGCIRRRWPTPGSGRP